MVASVFHKEPYTKQEVCQLLDVTEQALNDASLSEKTFSGILHVLYFTIVKPKYMYIVQVRMPECRTIHVAS